MCAADDCKVQLKLGVNRWSDILLVDMRREPSLSSLEGSDWWSVDLCFDEVRQGAPTSQSLTYMPLDTKALSYLTCW